MEFTLLINHAFSLGLYTTTRTRFLQYTAAANPACSRGDLQRVNRTTHSVPTNIAISQKRIASYAVKYISNFVTVIRRLNTPLHKRTSFWRIDCGLLISDCVRKIWELFYFGDFQKCWWSQILRRIRCDGARLWAQHMHKNVHPSVRTGVKKDDAWRQVRPPAGSLWLLSIVIF